MIKIIADTTCGIPLDKLSAQGIAALPQIIIFGEQSFRDDTEIDTETFLSKLRASKQLPKTAAPPPALYHPIFEQILAGGDTALVLTPSEKLSGTYRSAMLAAAEFDSDSIHVLDTSTIAGGLGTLVLHAKRWADMGMDVESMKRAITEMAAREKVLFLVDTLEYLHKGGRIGGASRLIGTMLNIKPILTEIDGQVELYEKVRTSKQALERLVQLNTAHCAGNPQTNMVISHCDAEAEAMRLADIFKSVLGVAEIPVYLAPPAIIVHAGPGLISTSCFCTA